MAFVHGRNTYISLAGYNLSTYTDASELDKEAEAHKVTTYGKTANVYAGGLLDGAAKMSGTYDNTASTGPRAVINPLVGTVVQLIRRPEGTGSGLPQDKVNVLVKKYSESNPVADMIKWSVDLQCSDTIDSTAQP